MVDFDLDDFVDLQALLGALHDLFDAEAFLQGMAASCVLVGHLQEGDVGPCVSVELLQHLLAELDGHCPVFFLGQDLKDAEVNHLPDVGLNCLLDCPGEVSEELFGVDPGDPHVVLVGDGGEVVNGSEELASDFCRRGGGEKGRDVEKVAFWGWVGEDEGLVEFFGMRHGLKLCYFLLEVFLLLLVDLSCLGCEFFLLFLLLLLLLDLLFLLIFFCFLAVCLFLHRLFFLCLFLCFLAVFCLHFYLVLSQQFLQPFVLLLLVAGVKVEIGHLSFRRFDG